MIDIKKAKRSKEEKEFFDNTYFEVTLEDETIISEKEYNWSDLSDSAIVEFGKGIFKYAMLSKYTIKKFKVFFGDRSAELEIPSDCRCYQMILSEIIHTPLSNSTTSRRTIGRIFGIVRDDQVIEEQCLSNNETDVQGVRFNYS